CHATYAWRQARLERGRRAGGQMAWARLVGYGVVAAFLLLFTSIGLSAEESARSTTSAGMVVQREPSSDGARALFALVAVGSLTGGFLVLRRLPTIDTRCRGAAAGFRILSRRADSNCRPAVYE